MQVDAIEQIATQQPIGRRAEVPSSEDAKWIEELSNQPIVYVTLGTVSTVSVRRCLRRSSTVCATKI